MPNYIRLIALALCAIGILYVAYSAVDEATTEKLDEPTLKELYAQADRAINDPQATRQLLQKRLHSSYSRKGNIIISVKNKPDEVKEMTSNKDQTIEMMVQGLSMTKIAKYEHKIIETKFTDDRKFAYVSSTEMTSGTVSVPLPDNKKADMPFNSASSCIETWTQDNKVLYMVRSDCTNKMAFLQ